MTKSKDNSINKILLTNKNQPEITEFVNYERQAAIHDLINENFFEIKEENVIGPFNINLSIHESILIKSISNEDNSFNKTYRIPVNSLKKIIKFYHNACTRYFDSIKDGSIDDIEKIENNRRKIHDEGAEILKKLMKKNFNIDHQTARRLFTLLYSLYI
ncbi:MAG: hypothetical protein CML87_04675 [Rhodobiaceae bacterium]|nr:hypothetical protein [Rhodobiaceae bacterium]